MTTGILVGHQPERRIPWGLFLFLHIIFLVANLDLTQVPFPAGQAASVVAIEQAQEQGMVGRRIAFVVLGAVAGTFLAGGMSSRPRINGVLGILLLGFLLWSLLSLTWADDVALTVRKVIVFSLLWTAAVWIALRLSFYELLQFSFLSNLATLMTCLAVEIVNGEFTPWLADFRFGGLFNPNATGQCLGMGLLAAVVLSMCARRGKGVIYICCALLFFGCLILTGSRTALVATMVALTAMVIIAKAGSHRLHQLAIGLALAGATICACYFIVGPDIGDRIAAVLSLGRSDSDLATLTLRTPMWKEIIDRYIATHPVTGYGYGGFWNTQHIVALSLLRPGTVYYHSHSGYLEMALSIGIGGAVVHVLTILLSLGKTLGAGLSGDLPQTFAAGFLIMLLVAMLAEAMNMSVLVPGFLAMVFIAKAAFAPQSPAPDTWDRTLRPRLARQSS